MAVVLTRSRLDAALRHYRPFWERHLEMTVLAAPADEPSALS